MAICLKCNKEFSRNVKIDGKRYCLQRRKYCLECSPFKQHNTKQLEKNPKSGTECQCQICEKKYCYKKSKGHGTKICNSCRSSLRRYKVKKELVEYKGGKCEKCGYNKNIKNLEFHHIDPEKKLFTISNRGGILSIDGFKKEVDKCILVCTLCHRDIHDEIDGKTKQLDKYLLNLPS